MNCEPSGVEGNVIGSSGFCFIVWSQDYCDLRSGRLDDPWLLDMFLIGNKYLLLSLLLSLLYNWGQERGDEVLALKHPFGT